MIDEMVKEQKAVMLVNGFLARLRTGISSEQAIRKTAEKHGLKVSEAAVIVLNQLSTLTKAKLEIMSEGSQDPSMAGMLRVALEYVKLIQSGKTTPRGALERVARNSGVLLYDLENDIHDVLKAVVLDQPVGQS